MYFILVMANLALIFRSHYSSLQCRVILQKLSEQAVYLCILLKLLIAVSAIFSVYDWLISLDGSNLAYYFVKFIKLHMQMDVHLIDLFLSSCVCLRYNQCWDVPIRGAVFPTGFCETVVGGPRSL